MRNAELTRKRDKPKTQLTVWEKAGEWQDLRDELAQAIMVARRYSRLVYLACHTETPPWAGEARDTLNERRKKVARYPNDLHSAAQYRLRLHDQTVIEVKPGHRQRWREHVRCQPSGEYTAKQVAAAMLAALGRGYDVTCWQDENGNVQWSEDQTP